jgi:hypothetical protein
VFSRIRLTGMPDVSIFHTIPLRHNDTPSFLTVLMCRRRAGSTAPEVANA